MAAEVTPTSSRSTAKSSSHSSRRASVREPARQPVSEPLAPLERRRIHRAPSERILPPRAAVDAPLSPQDSVDFLLHPTELAKGRRAAENYLSTFRTEESRRAAEEMLETLATVISGGKCDSVEFPWQQVRPYHGAAALTILKERGAPARIETLRCRKNASRSFRAVPDELSPARSAEDPQHAVARDRAVQTSSVSCVGETVSQELRTRGPAQGKRPAKPAQRNRLLADGEIRALISACASDGNRRGLSRRGLLRPRLPRAPDRRDRRPDPRERALQQQGRRLHDRDERRQLRRPRAQDRAHERRADQCSKTGWTTAATRGARCSDLSARTASSTASASRPP